MPTLQQQITEKFLAKLSGAKDLNEQKIEQLRALLATARR